MRRNIVHVLTEIATATYHPHLHDLAKMLYAMQRQQAQTAGQRPH